MSNHSKSTLLTASEIARYVYCHRAWAYDRKIIRRRRKLFRWLLILIWLLLAVAATGGFLSAPPG